MLNKILDWLTGCTHPRVSFPQTVAAGKRRSGAAMTTGTYIVCLDCGKEMAYDWIRMKVVSDEYRPETC